MFKPPEYIKYSTETQPQLIVVVDTEEEFDWNSEPDEKATSVDAIEKLYLIQNIFNEYGIKPCYVVDYPIASQTKSVQVLKEYFNKEQCEIGAHLHPWVNPPHGGNLTRSNMFPGNLAYDDEFSKLKILTETIKKSFNFTPQIYRAGRYGAGKNTTKILKELGYSIDLSVCSSFDFSDENGPDFSGFKAEPYWFGPDKDILEIPLTAAFVGYAGQFSNSLYKLAGKLDYLKIRAILSRSSIVDRLMLSPEGYTHNEHRKLTHFLLNRGVRIFSWNLHSTTVEPGNTGYTQTKRDVDEFLDSFKRYFDFFFGQLNGVATTPSELKRNLERK